MIEWNAERLERIDGTIWNKLRAEDGGDIKARWPEYKRLVQAAFRGHGPFGEDVLDTLEHDNFHSLCRALVQLDLVDKRAKSWYKNPTLMKESKASDDAKKQGLEYIGFGRYGKKGKVTHKVEKGRLVPVKSSEYDPVNAQKAKTQMATTGDPRAAQMSDEKPTGKDTGDWDNYIRDLFKIRNGRMSVSTAAKLIKHPKAKAALKGLMGDYVFKKGNDFVWPEMMEESQKPTWMEDVPLQKGAVVKVEGVPVKLKQAATAETDSGNAKELEKELEKELNETLITEDYQAAIVKQKGSWYYNPKIQGERWAAETVDLATKIANKYANSSFQKWILKNSINLDSTDWHYWINNLSKKYLAQVQFVLRNSTSKTPLQLLIWLDYRGGVLKSPLTWCLEVAAYNKNKDEYLAYYSRAFGAYGMSKEDAAKRFEEYHKKLIAKLGGVK